MEPINRRNFFGMALGTPLGMDTFIPKEEECLPNLEDRVRKLAKECEAPHSEEELQGVISDVKSLLAQVNEKYPGETLKEDYIWMKLRDYFFFEKGQRGLGVF